MHARFVELLAAPISTSCRVAGDRVFTLERGGGEAQFRLIVRSATDPAALATTLIDPAALLEDSTAALDWYYPSPDGRLVAFGVSIGGDERSTLRIVDVETGELLADTIPDTRWSSVAWTPSSDAFAYTRYPSGQEYGERVWWHVVGDHHGHDELVFGDLPIEESMQSITLSRDGRWLAVHCNVGWSRADVHLIDRETGTRTTLIEGVEAQTFVRVVDDRLIGVTNLDAPRGRVFTASVDAPTSDAWQTLVPESDLVIDSGGVEVAGDRCSCTARSRRWRWCARTRSTAPTCARSSCPGPSPSRASTRTRRRRRRSSSSSRSRCRRRCTVGRPRHGIERWGTSSSPVDADRFHVEQIRYPSTDGVDVPMFLVRRADVTPSPDTPCLLTGYGGFSIAATPAYSPIAIAVAEAGGMFADACIRGGAEEGEDWHRAGMREHKQQVFDDFHAAGDWLVSNGAHLTSPARAPRRLERRAADGRGDDPAARSRRAPSTARSRSSTWCATTCT